LPQPNDQAICICSFGRLEACAILGFYAVQIGGLFTDISRQPTGPIFKVKLDLLRWDG